MVNLEVRIDKKLEAMEERWNRKFDAYFNISQNPWDILPGVLFVKEAGGEVTDINGEEIMYESTSLIATNGKIHDKLLDLLKDI